MSKAHIKTTAGRKLEMDVYLFGEQFLMPGGLTPVKLLEDGRFPVELDGGGTVPVKADDIEAFTQGAGGSFAFEVGGHEVIGTPVGTSRLALSGEALGISGFVIPLADIREATFEPTPVADVDAAKAAMPPGGIIGFTAPQPPKSEVKS